MATNVDELYNHYIKPLSAHDRLRLMALMAQESAADDMDAALSGTLWNCMGWVKICGPALMHSGMWMSCAANGMSDRNAA